MSKDRERLLKVLVEYKNIGKKSLKNIVKAIAKFIERSGTVYQKKKKLNTLEKHRLALEMLLPQCLRMSMKQCVKNI